MGVSSRTYTKLFGSDIMQIKRTCIGLADVAISRTRYTYVQGDRNGNQEQVHLIKACILLEAIRDKPLLNDVDEVKVESSVHNSKDDFLATVPNLVEVDVSLADLETGRDPNAKDADVDGEKDEEAGPFELGTV